MGRYTKVMLAFGLSGLLQYIAAIEAGVPPSQTGALKFFVVQGLDTMFEDAVQALYRRNISGKPGSRTRIVGYLWVSLFLIWITPWWMYPGIRSTVPGKDSMPPWKLFTYAFT
jgi:hypothetical protein